MDISINYLAVLVAAIGGMTVGGLWYSPKVFGNLWAQLSGITPEALQAAKTRGMGKTYTLAFLGELLTAYVLAHFIAIQDATTLSLASSLVFWGWLGFIVPVMLNSVLWEGKPTKLFFLNIASRLVTLLVMGVIITLF